jgi:hypothetical protein
MSKQPDELNFLSPNFNALAALTTTEYVRVPDLHACPLSSIYECETEIVASETVSETNSIIIVKTE